MNFLFRKHKFKNFLKSECGSTEVRKVIANCHTERSRSASEKGTRNTKTYK